MDTQVYSGLQNQTMTDRTKKLCPSHEDGDNYWSASLAKGRGSSTFRRGRSATN
jgi:hypothetical protein